MSSSDIDSLCQWVYDTRKLWVRKVSAVVFQQVSGLFNMHMPIKNWLNWVCFFSGQSSTTEQSYHNHSENQAASCRIRCVDMVSATEEDKSSELKTISTVNQKFGLLLLDLSLTMSCEGQFCLIEDGLVIM